MIVQSGWSLFQAPKVGAFIATMFLLLPPSDCSIVVVFLNGLVELADSGLDA